MAHKDIFNTWHRIKVCEGVLRPHPYKMATNKATRVSVKCMVLPKLSETDSYA